MSVNDDKENKNGPSKDIGEAPERLWASHGLEDVYFQREAQVTWWTVLGGIAVAALLTELEEVFLSVNSERWYVLLYFAATLLVIVNSWVQTAWGSLVLKWPISIPTSLFLFFQGIAMSVAGLNVSKPSLWFGAIFFIMVTAILNQVSFSKSRAWVALPKEMVARAKIGILIYMLISLLTLGITIFLAFKPDVVFEIIFGFLALILSIMALIWQHIGMTEEKRRMQIP